MWYKKAKINVSEKELNEKLKKKIKESSFFERLFIEFGVDVNDIDEKLSFVIKELNGSYAQSDSNTIYLNKKLFADGDFFEEKIHFVIHEIIHWLTRQREKQWYFSDPEEIDAFSTQIAYELLRGKSKDDIRSLFWPIVLGHFKKKDHAKRLYDALWAKALIKLKTYG